MNNKKCYIVIPTHCPKGQAVPANAFTKDPSKVTDTQEHVNAVIKAANALKKYMSKFPIKMKQSVISVVLKAKTAADTVKRAADTVKRAADTNIMAVGDDSHTATNLIENARSMKEQAINAINKVDIDIQYIMRDKDDQEYFKRNFELLKTEINKLEEFRDYVGGGSKKKQSKIRKRKPRSRRRSRKKKII